MVNVACLDDVDPSEVSVRYWDGRHDAWDAGARSTPWPINRSSGDGRTPAERH